MKTRSVRLTRLACVVSALVLIVAACGGTSSTTTAGPTDTTAGATPTTAEATTTTAGEATTTAAPVEKLKVAILLPCALNDLSWCQSAYEGIKEIEADGSIELFVTDNAPFDAQGARRVISQYADDGVALIIGHSFDYGQTMLELAPDFPDTAFAWQGGCGEPCEFVSANVADYGIPLYEVGYLAGIVAAGTSATGVLGTNSGFDIPSCRATVEAFKLGAQEINPDIQQIDTFLGSWDDAALGKEATTAQADQDADVFIACGDAGARGMIQAARELGLSAFGYMGDESSLAPDNVVASLFWLSAPTFQQMIDDVAAGTFVGKFYQVPVADGGFELRMNPAFSAATISPEALALLEQRTEEIAAGSFEVPFIGTAPEA
jgi:basic membrane protein A